MYKQQLQKTVIKNIILNFGPQHPAAHGVLRLVLQIKGELIVFADAHIGLLHRGTEKLIESKHYLQNLPYFDRLDYVSMLAYEHTYILAIESLLQIKITKHDSYVRMLLLELTRILNHLLCIGCQAMDLGAVTPYFLGFEEREKIAEFYERLSGARMHAAYFRPGGLAFQIPKGFLEDVFFFISSFEKRLVELKDLLDNNRIWRERLINVGTVSLSEAERAGFSGVMLRGSGIAYDVRKNQPYELYSDMTFQIPVGHGVGDCYDRYNVRMEEMAESISIIKQCLFFLLQNNSHSMELFAESENKALKYKGINKNKIKSSMEALINHFKYYSTGLTIESNSVSIFTEAPKGEFAVYLFSDGTSKPYRCKIKAPGFNHLQSISDMTKGHLIADLVTVIGSLDIVFGEVDR